MYYQDYQQHATFNPILRDKIAAHKTLCIANEVELGLELLQHLAQKPEQTYYPHGIKDSSSEKFKKAEALTHALILAVQHYDFTLFDATLQWAYTNKVDCGIILEKHIEKIVQPLAQLNDKDRLEKCYDLYYPEKDLTKLRRFRFSMGSGVSPRVIAAIMRCCIEAKSWDVLEWITPLAQNHHKVAPSLGTTPYGVLSWEMMYTYLPAPQYDDVIHWWLKRAPQEDLQYTLTYAREGCNIRRMEYILQHLSSEGLEQLQTDSSIKKKYLHSAIEHETNRRQHVKISEQLPPTTHTSALRKI